MPDDAPAEAHQTGTQTGSTKPSAGDLDRYRDYLVAEWEAAALYRRLADAEKDSERAAVFRELAGMEEKHASRWRGLLEEAGAQLPSWRPSWRSRWLGLLARLAGTRRVIPILERAEGGDAEMYAADPMGLDLVADERMHGRIFERLMADRLDGEGGVPAIGRREEWHRGAGGGALRAGVFGVNDGLVSNLSLVMGVAGAEAGREFILLAGLAGLLAGAFSMATGEYVSMRVQREMFEREIDIERAELETDPEEERQELALIYRAKGLPTDEAERVATRLIQDKSTALDTLAREELGLDPGELGSPWGAAISSFLMFAIGAFLPVLPYILLQGQLAFYVSLALSGVALAAVGGLTSILTGRSLLFGAARMVGLGAVAAAVTHTVGALLGVALSG